MEDRLSSIDSLSSTLPIPIIFFFSICTALAQHKFLIKLCVCDNTLVYNAIYGPARFGQINRLTILVKFTQFAAVAQIIIRKYSVRNCESRPTFRLSLSLSCRIDAEYALAALALLLRWERSVERRNGSSSRWFNAGHVQMSAAAAAVD